MRRGETKKSTKRQKGGSDTKLNNNLGPQGPNSVAFSLCLLGGVGEMLQIAHSVQVSGGRQNLRV